VARKAYSILGLQSFYTAGEQEVRAWKIMKGTLAQQAVFPFRFRCHSHMPLKHILNNRLG